MKILICTQVIDQTDSSLGFFQKWVSELSTKFEHIEVICLKKGEYDLPANVSVHSLGKESIQGSRFINRLRYIFRFYRLVLKTYNNYDIVFVHMNQEYILLGGLVWLMLGKKIYMWRNHYDGSILTDIASLFCKKIFCTSKFSYTARYKKTVLMPVGVDENSCRMEVPITRVPHSILSLGRLDESKKPHLLIEALGIIAKEGITFTATFVGGTSKQNSDYPLQLQEQVKKLGITDHVVFVGAVPNTETFRYYRSHDIFVNCSKSGMLDKTIFKASACGCLVLATSSDFSDLVGSVFIFEDDNVEELARKLKEFLLLPMEERAGLTNTLSNCIKRHSLPTLVERLRNEMIA
jgi:glycosyltransferase involved in cell wall biosynthesis